MTAEHDRLERDRLGIERWKQWGPYLADRAWGTVREDYSATGEAWRYFPHDHARSRAYRWNEDGLFGICDDRQRICLAIALWNGVDPILKERLFGVSGEEGNHGEDVKELYWFLDSTPTHSYLRGLYKYPQRAFPYAQLIERNSARSRHEPEYELLDTGVFDDDRYFDIEVEYAKATPDDIYLRVTATNRGPETAPLHILPTIWFRNGWSWGYPDRVRPSFFQEAPGVMQTDHSLLGERWLHFEPDAPSLVDVVFCENETNFARLFALENRSHAAKDGINDWLVAGEEAAISRVDGSKAAIVHRFDIGPGKTVTVRARLAKHRLTEPFSDHDDVVTRRRRESDEYYAAIQPARLSDDERVVHRQAIAGLLWSKQYYRFDVAQWLDGDPIGPPPPESRRTGRNADWETLDIGDVISMPDTWEYPWFAAWDLAFHCLPLAIVDPEFAKHQLIALTREWYQHPNGQLPAYEWAFGDVNPPVHAWAAWRVYKIEQRTHGRSDRAFLERVFHKLLLNFTWWVNRKDAHGRSVFQGGFLGLDNISVFDRSAPLPSGGHLEQADGTAWMGMFCLNMLTIALELARTNAVYEDIASKFFEHFLYIARALNDLGLWDEHDEYYYDVLRLPDGRADRLEVRSIVGMIPLFAVETLEPELLRQFPGFTTRMDWFLENRPDLASLVSRWSDAGRGERRLLALSRGHRMKRVLARVLDENEMLSPFGIRSLSRHHLEHPFELAVNGDTYRVDYEAAESRSGVFGGNSNWRGPVWMPINYLLIEALQGFHNYYTDEFRIECPSGSGRFKTLGEVAAMLSESLISLFRKEAGGRRPAHGRYEKLQSDPHFADLVWFHEYFDGDTGAGLGATHQTGWTALVAKLLDQQGTLRRDDA